MAKLARLSVAVQLGVGVAGIAIAVLWVWSKWFAAPELTAAEKSFIDDAYAVSVRGRTTLNRVAIYDSEGRHDSDKTLDLQRILRSQANITYDVLSPGDFRSEVLRQYDLVVVPGGRATEQSRALGDAGRQAIRDFVSEGGGYVGICAGGYLACSEVSWGLGIVNAKALLGDLFVPGRGLRPMASRGSGTVKIRVTEVGKAVLGDRWTTVYTPYTSGPIISSAGRNDLSNFVSLAVFRSEIFEYEGQAGTMINTPAMAASTYGSGRVLIVSPHLEKVDQLDSLLLQAFSWAAKWAD